MRPSQGDDWKRRQAAVHLFGELVRRARAFRERLPQIHRLVEERDRLGWQVEEDRRRRQELDQPIGAFYTGWPQLGAEVRAAGKELAGLLPAHEVEAFSERLSETAGGPMVEALEAVQGRLEEFFAEGPGRLRSGRHWAARQPGKPTAARPPAGRWVTAAEYAASAGVSLQTLANWRWQDRKAGRDGPGPGKPLYRCFGRAVRYFLAEA